jgi:Xaa-Pro aminopeptidase
VPNSRQFKIVNRLSKDGLNAAVMFRPENIFYLTGFWGEAAAVCTNEKIKLFVPELEVSRAENESHECEVIRSQRGKGLVKSLLPSLYDIKACSDCNDFQLVNQIHSKVNKKNFVCDSEPFLVVRSVKEQNEIDRIAEAASILDKLYQVCLEEIKIGVSERGLQAKLICEASRLGGSFPTYPFTLNPFIIAAGSNGSFPHAEVSDRSFLEGDLIVVDLTIRYGGYISDATRTFGLGKVSGEEKKLYNIVKMSQSQGLDAIKPSIKCKDVDLACRGYISKHGYEKKFIHSTGHGVGLEVHELPWIRPEEDDVLEENMVITVEPGIYIKSKFGIRIEDTIVVKSQKSQTTNALTTFTKDLIII